MKSIVVYRPFPTSNHNHCTYLIGAWTVVYRPFPTSNHNYGGLDIYAHGVVYRPFPTSNHNHRPLFQNLCLLYIVRFLHQTTTKGFPASAVDGCISSVSYIKPQHVLDVTLRNHRCISSVSYIKPQPYFFCLQASISCISSVSYIKPQHVDNHSAPVSVVYRPFPTSNHNLPLVFLQFSIVVYRPFPTSNHNWHRVLSNAKVLYIVRFLHQTTTYCYR